LRRGVPGEGYAGIRKDHVNVEGRPVLVDDEGPFGNPTSDSFRTRVEETTVSLRMVIFSPRGYSDPRLQAHAEWAAEAMQRHLGAPHRFPQTRIAVLD
jgi:DNA/RNA-binding domain of Phe-tRNA-synthetase-like protein